MNGIYTKTGRFAQTVPINFQIDFDILAGDIEQSRFHGDQIRCDWQQQPFEPASPVAELIAQQWQHNLDAAEKHGQRLFDGSLGRLVNFNFRSNTLFLTLQPTSYRLFSTTNLKLDLPMIPQAGDSTCLSIRELAGKQVFTLPSPYLANPLNVIAMIVRY